VVRIAKWLAGVDLLGAASEAKLKAIARIVVYRSLPRGALVRREAIGEPLAELCMVYSGQVALCRDGSPVAFLEAGQAFGTIETISSALSSCSAVATGAGGCELLCISQQAYDEAVRPFRGQETWADLDFLSKHVLFRSWGRADLLRLRAALTHRVYPAGETICKQGSKPTCLWLVKRGICESFRLRRETLAFSRGSGQSGFKTVTRRIMLGRVLPGGIVGEASLIRNSPRISQVVALSTVEALELGADALLLLARNGTLAKLAEQVARYPSDRGILERVEMVVRGDEGARRVVAERRRDKLSALARQWVMTGIQTSALQKSNARDLMTGGRQTNRRVRLCSMLQESEHDAEEEHDDEEHESGSKRLIVRFSDEGMPEEPHLRRPSQLTMTVTGVGSVASLPRSREDVLMIRKCCSQAPGMFELPLAFQESDSAPESSPYFLASTPRSARPLSGQRVAGTPRHGSQGRILGAIAGPGSVSVVVGSTLERLASASGVQLDARQTVQLDKHNRSVDTSENSYWTRSREIVPEATPTGRFTGALLPPKEPDFRSSPSPSPRYRGSDHMPFSPLRARLGSTGSATLNLPKLEAVSETLPSSPGKSPRIGMSQSLSSLPSPTLRLDFPPTGGQAPETPISTIRMGVRRADQYREAVRSGSLTLQTAARKMGLTPLLERGNVHAATSLPGRDSLSWQALNSAPDRWGVAVAATATAQVRRASQIHAQ
jgi:CRP-like cAMP-binding protein